MKRKYGKIAVYTIITLMSLITVMVIASKAMAAVSTELTESQTFVLPSSSSVTHTANTYIIIWDTETGNIVDANGVTAAGNTWTEGDIATAVHAQNGLVWTATIPALNVNYKYGMAIFDAASPAKDDVPTMGPFLYDPRENIVYSDTNPIFDKRVRIAL